MNSLRWLALSLLFLVGCGVNAPNDREIWTTYLGKNCSIQFRRGDALGGGGSIPSSFNAGEINGARVAIVGKLQQVGSKWLVIKMNDDQSEYVIPFESILLVHCFK